MNLIFFLMAFLLLLLILIYSVELKVKFIFDTENEDMIASLYWLYPLFRVDIIMENMKPVITVFLLKKKIFTKTLIPKKKNINRLELVSAVKTKDIQVMTDYGFKDCFTTGIICGILNFASDVINIDRLQHNPDFLAIHDYIYVKATAQVNIGLTLSNLFKLKFIK